MSFLDDAIESVLRERLNDLHYRLNSLINPPRDTVYDKYFSRLMLEHAVDELNLEGFAAIRPPPKGRCRTIRFFKRKV